MFKQYNLSSPIVIVLIVSLVFGCGEENSKDLHFRGEKLSSDKIHSGQRKKVLYVDSYHHGYEWSDGITRGILKKFKASLNVDGSANDSNSIVKLKIARMDTKRNSSEKSKDAAALRVKGLIDSWKPDVVIASDDNASKHLIMKYYRNVDLPFVFCGVNWDVSEYGFPCRNITGMIEVALIPQLIHSLKLSARGERVGVITADVFTERKIVKTIKQKFGIDFKREVFAKTFDEWKREYVALQSQVDLLIFINYSGITDFNVEEATDFIEQNTKIPTGSSLSLMIPLVHVCFSKISGEQGEWAAETALKILNGKSPSDIPIVKNKHAKINVNMNLAKKSGLRFPVELLENAHLVSAKPKKVLYVNSYHKGYLSSDNIEEGFKKVTHVKTDSSGALYSKKYNFKMRIHRMDTKKNKSEKFKQDAALKARKIIEEWKPDIVIASDDNASKYLIEPFYKNSDLPFVFCGVNWDASVYGFPCSNVTGVVEVEPVKETISLLKKYAKGTRLGYLGPNNLSEQKKLPVYKNVMGIKFEDGDLVNTFDEWKNTFLRLQKTTDMLLIFGNAGIKKWDEAEAISFIKKNIRIPTGGTVDSHMPISMFGVIEVSEEQGWKAGKMAIDILNGKSPEEISLKANQGSKILINMPIVNALGVKLPVELLEQASLIELEKGKGKPQ